MSFHWHAGELQLQRSIGVAERMAVAGPIAIRDHLSDQHVAFYPLLPFVALGAVDPAGDAWATLRGGPPGFLHAPDTARLHVGVPRDAADPAEAGLQDGDSAALLGIDLQTRRRNRLNGAVHRDGDAGFDLLVAQSFGNCPKYIRQRAWLPSDAAPAAAERMPGLDAAARELVMAAETFFVASYVDDAEGRQVDVSHRGGKPGFVRVGEDGALTIPDFAGNHYFNTLGNIVANPKAGLVFVNFAAGDLLQMTGDAALLDGPDVFAGAERLWRFTPRQVVRRRAALPVRFATDADGVSPFLARTGAWR